MGKYEVKVEKMELKKIMLVLKDEDIIKVLEEMANQYYKESGKNVKNLRLLRITLEVEYTDEDGDSLWDMVYVELRDAKNAATNMTAEC